MSKTIYSGKEGQGKSLKLAMVAHDLVVRNSRWAKISGHPRPLVSNLKFSEDFYKWATKIKGVPIIYWQNLDELIAHENCDVIIDEVGNYFDSRNWADLSLDARRWLTQGSKMGIELYGSAQDFAQVDKSFRRLVNQLVQITKVLGSRRPAATKPPPKRIWGLCMGQELDPNGYDEDKKKFAGGSWWPSTLFFIRKEACEIFDTTQKIVKSAPMPLKHSELFCELGDKCTAHFHKIVHT